jgi:hypothetical protein
MNLSYVNDRSLIDGDLMLHGVFQSPRKIYHNGSIGGWIHTLDFVESSKTEVIF